LGAQCTGPGGVWFASWVMAAMIRCQAAALVMIAGRCELVGASGAFLERPLTVALEHQLCGPPNVDLGYHGAKVYGHRR
jgi:hypothetical protein